MGGDDALLALLDEQVDVLEGDFSRSEPEIPAGMDVVIHSAAAVSFDPPIDEGFQTNLLGARNLYRAATAHNTPHLVHVSTAYVAGVQKGVIPEGPLDHKIDYDLEAEMALQARDDVEAQSRKPEMLEHFMAKAAKEHSRAGPSTVSIDAEERRKSWIDKRLIEYGRMRARTLGWPDVYTFTKAHGGARGRGPRARTGPEPVDRAPLDHRVGARSTRRRDGSTASRWPTRSSARTAWGRSRSSRASPRASST